MSLKTQLICASLLLLLLPWAGYEYLQTLSQALQQRQIETLTANNRMIAQALALSQPALAFHPQSEHLSGLWPPAPQPSSLYCQQAKPGMRADGFAVDQEWVGVPWQRYAFPSGAATAAAALSSQPSRLEYRCAVDEQTLYLFVRVADDQVRYQNPAVGFSRDESELARMRNRPFSGDRLWLHTGSGRSYVLTAIAPGQIRARYPLLESRQPQPALSEEARTAEVIDTLDTDNDLSSPTPTASVSGSTEVVDPLDPLAVRPQSAPVTPLQAMQPRWSQDSRVEAVWTDQPAGYQLEMAIPRALLQGRLELALVDVDDIADTDKAVSEQHIQGREWRPGLTSAYWYLYASAALEQMLKPFARGDMRLQLLSPSGLQLASVGHSSAPTAAELNWLLQRLYRWVLTREQAQQPGYLQTLDLSQRPEVQAAMTGHNEQAIYGAAQSQPRLSDHVDMDAPLQPDLTPLQAGEQMLSSAVPIFAHQAPNAAAQGEAGENTKGPLLAILVAEQSTREMASITDQAFARLFWLSMGTLLIVMLALLLYASWLSWRIRRLSLATRQALHAEGPLRSYVPASRARDEIGQLTRQYGALMARIDEYTDYLQTLSRKLSHELRTPLAIIHSSLDNLSSRKLTTEQQTYVQRAREGGQRLGQLLTAMSEARRVEESIAQAEPEVFRIDRLLRELMQAYEDIYPGRHMLLTGLPESTETAAAEADSREEASADRFMLRAVPDLLVQMLDKLMDNAYSFCPQGGRIELCYEDAETPASGVVTGYYRLTLSNDGPLLPDTMQQQLFDNLVSLRAAGEGQHLGMGLYIVQLVVSCHRGQVFARNRADGSGVEFVVELPKT